MDTEETWIMKNPYKKIPAIQASKIRKMYFILKTGRPLLVISFKKWSLVFLGDSVPPRPSPPLLTRCN